MGNEADAVLFAEIDGPEPRQSECTRVQGVQCAVHRPVEASHIGQVVEARRRLKVQQKIRKLRAIPIQVGAKRQVFAHESLRGRFEEIGANPNHARPEVSAPRWLRRVLASRDKARTASAQRLCEESQVALRDREIREVRENRRCVGRREAKPTGECRAELIDRRLRQQTAVAKLVRAAVEIVV